MLSAMQPEHMRRFSAQLRAQLFKSSRDLQLLIAEIEAENIELRRRLGETNDNSAQSSLVSKLSPAGRAEFNGCRRALKGESDEQKLVAALEMFFRSSARNLAR